MREGEERKKEKGKLINKKMMIQIRLIKPKDF